MAPVGHKIMRTFTQSNNCPNWDGTLVDCANHESGAAGSNGPGRRRDSGDLHPNRTQMVATGEIEGFPVVAAKGDIGRRRRAVDDAAEFFAGPVHDVNAAGAAAVNIAFYVDLHAVG